MRGTWQTTDSGLAVPLAIGAAVLAVLIAGPVAAAVTAVAQALITIIAVLAGLGAVGGTAYAVYRVRHPRPVQGPPAPRAGQVPWRRAEPLPAPRRPAVEPPREVHLHFHGVTAEDVAAILADVNRDRG
jgi:hypothetical protein